MRPLRTWQTECVAHAQARFLAGQRQFLAVATPGAGKTLMAAELARQLVAAGDIDLVYCFTPSVAVAAGFTQTLSRHTGRSMAGVAGALGRTFTYQQLPFLGEDCWQAFRHHRVLVILDEIHHCGGQGPEGNRWGQQVMAQILTGARFTLSLSGTPWRSDKRPVTSAYYDDTQLVPDYVYDLRRAIAEGVCRAPRIVATDCADIQVESTCGPTRHFGSFREAFAESPLAYRQLLIHPGLTRHLLGQAVDRLAALRRRTPDAGGLVVATSIAHARKLVRCLRDDHDQRATLVASHQPDAQARLETFAQGDSPWLVAVGMVSEGTDIPRLQVCCHLSAIKTALHFRQVLGRIIRCRQGAGEIADLFIIAEPTLVGFAQALAQTVPEQEILVQAHFESVTSAGHPSPPTASPGIDLVEETLPPVVSLSGEETSRRVSLTLADRFFQEMVALQADLRGA